MTRRITFTIAAALITLLLSAGLAAAQDPPETTTATRLEPGLNLVGWVGEPTPVSQLFRQIPQLEGIWAWDAELREWIVAAPNAPEWLGGLGRVTAGMGLHMQLGGDEPFLWRRSTEPTRGLVKLRTGWNLVAWSGADGAAIGDVVKGIGWSLRTVRRWDAANQQWGTWTSPERSAQVIANTGPDQDAGNDAERPGIRRGEALWIEVARAVDWLQPTDILPRLVFPGGASQALQSRVREDLRATLSFFRDQYSIQAEPDFTVYVAKNADALIDAQKDDGEEIDDSRAASIRDLWNRTGGWAGLGIVVKQSQWPGGLSDGEIAWGRYTVTHEYFHVMQRQLLGSASWRILGVPLDAVMQQSVLLAGVSTWLVEGTASWVVDEHRVLDGERTWGDLRADYSSRITTDTPALRSSEIENATWQYTLGWLAIDRLTADTDSDSPVEFWRRFAPTGIGSHGRWASTLGWQTTFEDVSGQTVSEFYADFDTWQREQAAANSATVSSYHGNWIRGRVTDEHGAPASGVFVNAVRVEGDADVGWTQRAETGDDGTFAVRAPEDGDYRLYVLIGGDHLHAGTHVEYVTVANADVPRVDFQLPPTAGGRQIRGRIVGPNDEPLAGVSVELISARVDQWIGGVLPRFTAPDGSFALLAEVRPGSYRLRVVLTEPPAGGDGCSVSYEAEIVNEDVDVGLLRVSEGTCVHQISGHFVDSSGDPLSEKWLNMHGPDGSTYGFWTNADGHFEIRAPSDGAYTFSVHLRDQPSCWYRLDGDALGSPDSPVRVDGADTADVVLRLPDTIEELCE